MKIICTKREKKELTDVIMKSQYCLKFLTDVIDCGPSICVHCLNNNIEWEITDE